MIKFLVAQLVHAVRIVTVLAAGLSLGTVTPGDAAVPTDPAPFRALAGLVGQARDAAPTLQACFDATPSGQRVALRPGRYLLTTPVTLRHAMTLTTWGVSVNAPRCSRDERRCAVFRLAVPFPAPKGTVMPFEIAANGVRFDHLVFEGTRLTDPDLSAKRCASAAERPVGGGVRIIGADVAIRHSVFCDLACYTALEYATVPTSSSPITISPATARILPACSGRMA